MNTGEILWTIEETGSVTPYKYPKLCAGTWIFSCVVYGAKIELLSASISSAVSWGKRHNDTT